MELHELHIHQQGSGPQGHRHAVARGIAWICGTRVDLARSTGRQDHGAGRQHGALSRHFVQDNGAATTPVHYRQVDGKPSIQPLNARLPGRIGHQRPHHFIAGGIASRTEDAAPAVCSFPGERKPFADFVELRPPGDQFLNPFRSFFHQDSHGLATTEAVTGFQRIGEMAADVVFFAERHRDATLGIHGVAFQGMPFGQHQHTPGAAQFNGRAQPGDAASDDEKVCFNFG